MSEKITGGVAVSRCAEPGCPCGGTTVNIEILRENGEPLIVAPMTPALAMSIGRALLAAAAGAPPPQATKVH